MNTPATVPLPRLLANGYTEVLPDTTGIPGVYWVAARGQCLAVIAADPARSCIAEVEEHMSRLYGTRGPGWGDLYVIWQPNDHSPAAWARWCKKWSDRTEKGTA